MIKIATVSATGRVRIDDRQPVHQSEYITIYYRQGVAGIIAEQNGRVLDLNSSSHSGTQWDEVRADINGIVSKDLGFYCDYAGPEAINLMIKQEWISPDSVVYGRLVNQETRTAAGSSGSPK